MQDGASLHVRQFPNFWADEIEKIGRLQGHLVRQIELPSLFRSFIK